MRAAGSISDAARTGLAREASARLAPASASLRKRRCHDATMAKWRCRCGEVLTNSGPIPNANGLYVMTEERYEERADAPDFDLIRDSVGAHRCPRCGRLWVWWNGSGEKPDVYEPESR
jgi:hypothetical protein